jgi:hypothetical protein
LEFTQKRLLIFELKQLLNVIQNEFPNQIKEIEIKCRNNYLQSLSSFALIPAYLQLLNDASAVPTISLKIESSNQSSEIINGD